MRRGGAGDSSRSSRAARRSTSEPISAISSRSSSIAAARRARASSCAAPFSPASGLRSSCASPFSAADKRAGQRQRRILAGEFVDRMRLQQPAASSRRRQPHVGEARRVAAGKRQRQPPQAHGCRAPVAAPASAPATSPSASSAASGRPGRRRALTPSQRAKAGLQPHQAAVGVGPGDRRGRGRRGREAGSRRSLHQFSADGPGRGGQQRRPA